MTILELKTKLLEAYSDLNLNKITLALLNIYKEQHFGVLNKIAELIADFVNIEIDEKGKGFSKLMMLYHPDRGEIHRNAIALLAEDDNYDELLEYTHILKLIHIEEIAASIDSLEDLDYSPVYEWDFQADGFNTFNETRKTKADSSKVKRPKNYSFYEAFKIRIYGHSKTEIPYYYFEDIDEIELSESLIDNLDGIQFCKHAASVDLSGNQITDISELWELSNIEELNLSENRIEIIDVISNLSNLRLLDISHNHINDIAPLFELGKLESVILTGNPLKKQQIDELIDMGIEVELR